jgi:hypothetical protein
MNARTVQIARSIAVFAGTRALVLGDTAGIVRAHISQGTNEELNTTTATSNHLLPAPKLNSHALRSSRRRDK